MKVSWLSGCGQPRSAHGVVDASLLSLSPTREIFSPSSSRSLALPGVAPLPGRLLLILLKPLHLSQLGSHCISLADWSLCVCLCVCVFGVCVCVVEGQRGPMEHVVSPLWFPGLYSSLYREEGTLPSALALSLHPSLPLVLCHSVLSLLSFPPQLSSLLHLLLSLSVCLPLSRLLYYIEQLRGFPGSYSSLFYSVICYSILR